MYIYKFFFFLQLKTFFDNCISCIYSEARFRHIGNIHDIKFLQRVSLFFPSLKLKRQKEIGDPWPWTKMALSSSSLPCKHHSLLPLHTLVLSQLESCLLHVPTHKALPFIQMAWLDKALSTCRCRAAGAYCCNYSWWQQLALMSLVPDEASLCNGVVWL